MGVEMEENRGAFDGHRAAELMVELREAFGSGRTRSYEWRVAQLKALFRMIDEKEAEIMAALYSDLAKPELEAFLHEVSLRSCFLLIIDQKRGFCPLFFGYLMFKFVLLISEFQLVS